MNKEIFQSELLSVVVPVYNSEKYIICALDSLKKQSHKNFEVIIIDGSTDNTGKKIDSYIGDDARFNHYSVSNRGPGFARNYGIDRASGAYVTFMDHDDFVHEDWLLELYSVISRYNVDIALNSGFYNVYSDDSVESFHTEVHPGVYSLSNNLKARMSHGWIAPWFKLMSLEFIKKHAIQFSLDNKFDDVLFHFMAIHYANSIAFSEKSMYYHRIHEKCVTSNALDNKDMYFYHFKTLGDMLELDCDNDIVKMFLRFIRSYASKVDSREKYNAIYIKITSLLAEGDMKRARDVAMLGAEQAKIKCE